MKNFKNLIRKSKQNSSKYQRP